MFVQQLVQADNKGNIKAPNYSKLHITGPFWVESTVTGGFPSQSTSNA